MNIIVVAPGHHEKDRRVNRTIEILVNIFNKVTVVYEKRWSVLEGDDGYLNNYDNLNYKYVEDTGLTINLLKEADSIINEVNEIKEATHIYIHDSGLLGLSLVRALNNKYPDKFIIFDYHDWIPWELYYQINKRVKKPILSKYLSKGVERILKLFIFHKVKIDILIGISAMQVAWLKDFLIQTKNDTSSFVFPNIRPELNKHHNLVRGDNISLLWVGSIMEGRDLDFLLNFLDTSSHDNIQLDIVGQVKSLDLFECIKDHSKITYHGAFNTDEDILDKIQGKNTIGFFGGWFDSGLGINEIASPNKIYSYLNLGLPVLYNHKLKGLKFIENNGAGISYTDFDTLQNGYNEIVDNYEKYHKEAINLKAQMSWEEDYKKRYHHFLEANLLN